MDQFDKRRTKLSVMFTSEGKTAPASPEPVVTVDMLKKQQATLVKQIAIQEANLKIITQELRKMPAPSKHQRQTSVAKLPVAQKVSGGRFEVTLQAITTLQQQLQEVRDQLQQFGSARRHSFSS